MYLIYNFFKLILEPYIFYSFRIIFKAYCTVQLQPGMQYLPPSPVQSVSLSFFFLRRPRPTVAFIYNRSSTVLTNINNFNNNTGKITLLCVGDTFGTTVHIRLKRRHSLMTAHFRYKIIHSIIFLQQNGKKTTLTNGDDLPLQDI